MAENAHDTAGSSPQIHRLEPHEWRALRELRLHALEESPDSFGATLAEALSHPISHWKGWTLPNDERDIVTYVVDAPPWAAMACGQISTEQPKRVHLFAMWVDPRFRRHGFGATLIDAVGTWGREHGCTTYRLDVVDVNKSAVALYRHHGFVEIDETCPLRSNPALTCLAMDRPL